MNIDLYRELISNLTPSSVDIIVISKLSQLELGQNMLKIIVLRLNHIDHC